MKLNSTDLKFSSYFFLAKKLLTEKEEKIKNFSKSVELIPLKKIDRFSSKDIVRDIQFFINETKEQLLSSKLLVQDDTKLPSDFLNLLTRAKEFFQNSISIQFFIWKNSRSVYFVDLTLGFFALLNKEASEELDAAAHESVLNQLNYFEYMRSIRFLIVQPNFSYSFYLSLTIDQEKKAYFDSGCFYSFLLKEYNEPILVPLIGSSFIKSKLFSSDKDWPFNLEPIQLMIIKNRSRLC